MLPVLWLKRKKKIVKYNSDGPKKFNIKRMLLKGEQKQQKQHQQQQQL